jgi:hypothetical protein
VLDAAFAGDAAKRARTLAPDLYAEADRARHEASRAKGPAARREHEETAHLFLAAAVAEGERIDLDRERARLDAEVERLVAARVEHERARLAAEAQLGRRDAARAARVESASVLDPRAYEGTTRSRAEREQADRAAAAFVLDRAELLLAAATALGLPDETRVEARGVIDGARNAGASAHAGLRRARLALAAAERALATARNARPAAGQP